MIVIIGAILFISGIVSLVLLIFFMERIEEQINSIFLIAISSLDIIIGVTLIIISICTTKYKIIIYNNKHEIEAVYEDTYGIQRMNDGLLHFRIDGIDYTIQLEPGQVAAEELQE